MARTAAGLTEARVVTYHRPRQYRATIYSSAETPPPAAGLSDLARLVFSGPALPVSLVAVIAGPGRPSTASGRGPVGPLASLPAGRALLQERRDPLLGVVRAGDDRQEVAQVRERLRRA